MKITKYSSTKKAFSIALNTLGKRDSKKLGIILVIQIFLGIFELIALSLVALLGSIAINGISTGKANSNVTDFFALFGFQLISFQAQVAALGLIAALFMIIRTVATMVLSRKTLFFLSYRSAKISTNLVSKLLSTSLLAVRERSTQETAYALTNGVSRILIGTLATATAVIVDSSLLLIITLTLLVLDPIMALSTVALFALIGFSLYKFMHVRATKLGDDFASLSISSNLKILESLAFYREAVIRKRRGFYSKEIEKIRKDFTNTEAEIAFLPATSKYIIEISLVVGGLLICALQFIFKDANEAISSLVVFLAAGTRIAPAVLRIQQGALQVNTSISAAAPTFDLILRLNKTPSLNEELIKLNTDHFGFSANISFDNVTLQYPGSDKLAINKIQLEVHSGKFIAIVGPSGAGKTSLVDCLLGIIEPTSGEITIAGLSPMKSIDKWPGAIGYVPQDVVIVDGSIKQNIGIGYSDEEIDEKLVHEALKISALTEFVDSLANGIETNVGEQGAKLSGGQRQRLGIARAMYTKPKLLVLDEATSSLDGQTEFEIARSIQSLKEQVTVVMIAHRLSTIKDADMVVYLSEGKVTYTGSFNEVRKNVPEFDKQAKLMGL
jgi:ABC-type multidrug transport system fused ATPase/permease subunit